MGKIKDMTGLRLVGLLSLKCQTAQIQPTILIGNVSAIAVRPLLQPDVI